jgi:hypothetical protein
VGDIAWSFLACASVTLGTNTFYLRQSLKQISTPRKVKKNTGAFKPPKVFTTGPPPIKANLMIPALMVNPARTRVNTPKTL